MYVSSLLIKDELGGKPSLTELQLVEPEELSLSAMLRPHALANLPHQVFSTPLTTGASTLSSL